MISIKRIDGLGLCLGCGLCEALNPSQIIMKLEPDGFYHPHFLSGASGLAFPSIAAICPGVNLFDDRLPSTSSPVWGPALGVYSGWASDDRIRFAGSSGGVVTALAIFLLQQGLIEGVLQVGPTEGARIENGLTVSRSSEEILANASSRYAPALVFSEIRGMLDHSEDRFLFIGKPCDVTALKLFLKYFPWYRSRIVWTIAIFCAGMPSYNGTLRILEDLHVEGDIQSLRYRGDGWPGRFRVNNASGQEYSQDYNTSWGSVLNKYLHFRCKICPDGVGQTADLAVGDAWETKDGYPDFEERDGKSLIVARTPEGRQLLETATNGGDLVIEPLSLAHLKAMQPYQYERAHLSGWRLAGVQLATGFALSARHLAPYRNALRYPLHKGVMQTLGTLRRLIFRMARTR